MSGSIASLLDIGNAASLGGSSTQSNAGFGSTAAGGNAYTQAASYGQTSYDYGGGSSLTGGGQQSLVSNAAFTQAGQVGGSMPGVALDEPFTVGFTPAVAQEVAGVGKGLGQSVVQGFDSLAGGMLSGITNYVTRGFLIFLAIVLVGVAMVALMFRSDTVKATATKAAAAVAE